LRKTNQDITYCAEQDIKSSLSKRTDLIYP